MTVRCDGAATAVGRVRRVNEDSYLMSPPLYAVADGMGGHGSGDVASALAIDALQARARLHRLSADVVLATLYEANRVIVEATPERGDAGGMGTTVATDLQLPASTGVFLAQSVTIALMGANNRRAGAAARPAAVPAPVSPGGTQGEPGSTPGPEEDNGASAWRADLLELASRAASAASSLPRSPTTGGWSRHGWHTAHHGADGVRGLDERAVAGVRAGTHGERGRAGPAADRRSVVRSRP
jgi:hypothetical protein